MSGARNLGRMRHRLEIQIITRVADGGGGNARADVPGKTVWARVEVVKAHEASVYAQLQQRVTHKAIIRRTDLKQGQTVIWKRPTSHGGDLSLYVESVVDADPDGRPGEFLKAMLREGGNL